jgi:hypothetical protein
MTLKRWVSFVFCGLGATILGGCPIYPDSRDHRVCLENGACYSCPDDYYSSDCYAYGCGSDYDCPTGYGCFNGQCALGPGADGGYADGGACTRPSDCPSGQTCGSDDRCHAGDCSSSGCPSGYQCKLSGGTLQCVGSGTPDGGGDSGFSGCHNDSE